MIDCINPIVKEALIMIMIGSVLIMIYVYVSFIYIIRRIKKLENEIYRKH